jgi:hypothetical protein
MVTVLNKQCLAAARWDATTNTAWPRPLTFLLLFLLAWLTFRCRFFAASCARANVLALQMNDMFPHP